MTNKERLEVLETGLGMVQDELQKLSMGNNDKLRGMEQTFNRTLEDSLKCMMEMMLHHQEERETSPQSHRRSEEPQASMYRGDINNPLELAPPRHIKLEFPRFNGGDPTEWISKAKQYFSYHDMPREQRISFASYHLTEEANEWWQAVSKARNADLNPAPWEVFEAELWMRFGPMDGENFDEALSHIRQTGSLLEYQREFERLQNKIEGWTEKSLVGAYMGGLNTAISNGIRIFKPKTLLEVINLARHQDDQLQREKRWFDTPSQGGTAQARTSPNHHSIPTPKKLNWEEIKKKRSLGLCFSCDERYMPGHKCAQPQLLLMEGAEDSEEEEPHVDVLESSCGKRLTNVTPASLASI